MSRDLGSHEQCEDDRSQIEIATSRTGNGAHYLRRVNSLLQEIVIGGMLIESIAISEFPHPAKRDS